MHVKNLLCRFQATGYFSLSFVDGQGTSEWDELHLYRRVRTVIGIYHCACDSDLRVSYHAFKRYVEQFRYATQACILTARIIGCVPSSRQHSVASSAYGCRVIEVPSVGRFVAWHLTAQQPASQRLSSRRMSWSCHRHVVSRRTIAQRTCIPGVPSHSAFCDLHSCLCSCNRRMRM